MSLQRPDLAEHLEHEVGGGEGGVAAGVVRGGDLHQVAAHQVQAAAAPGDGKNFI